MRNRAGGLLIENGKILLIHRIKNINGERKEYYVVPGGGIEEKENIKEATIRELKEETGLNIKLIKDEPLITFKTEKGNQYFSLINKVSGVLGTGDGPEFNDPVYKNMGEFILEFIDINDIIERKINRVPDKVRMSFIECTKSLNKKINDINSSDYLNAKSITIEE